MRIAGKLIYMIGMFLLIGCGGGGSNKANGVTNSTTQAYQNKKLPVIKQDAIPDIALTKNVQKSQKITKQFKEVADISKGFTELKEKALFFYQKQLEMNIQLGYMDSVWEQIESYCQDKNICKIPSGKIVFTYTEALFERDSKLIKEYENKTGDTGTYGDLLDNLKNSIGQKVKFGDMTLVIYNEGKYKYALDTEYLEDSQTLIHSVVKWNDDNSSFLINESVWGVVTGKKVEKAEWIATYTYDDVKGTKINKFTTQDNFLLDTDSKMEFREREDGSIYYVYEQYNNKEEGEIPYHAEGSLSNSGGYITYTTEGYFLYETFDSNGLIKSFVNCMNSNTDIDNIKDNDTCTIQDSNIVKKYLTSNIYTLAVPFWNIDDFTPTSSPDYQTFVKFDDNNSMMAVVDCTTFKAKYKIEEYGISFSNITKQTDTSLKCLYPQIEDNFEKMLQEGLPFGNAIDDSAKNNVHFSLAFGLFPNFDNTDRDTFDFDKFYRDLHANEYVDSPLMNSVYDIKSAYEFAHSDGKLYNLSQSPQVIVEDSKIEIDILDAVFEADIEVVDATHIKFNNIQRTNKDNIEYPEDTTCTDTEEGEDECIGDPTIESSNSDRVFADIVDKFLNETIKVGLYTTDYKDIYFQGTNLNFVGTTRRSDD